jgi:Uma2 family endonuclease
MNAPLTETAPAWTLTDLAERFGPMPLSRICFDPWPGTATEADVLEKHDRENRLFELVDGILVEKTVGFQESLLAVRIAALLYNFLAGKRLGKVAGADGMIRLAPGLVRIPDVAFFAASRFPEGRVPTEPIPWLAPDLAVEVLSISNTERESHSKREDYFQAGCQLVWEVDPRARTVRVYTAPETFTVLVETDTLDGGTVLPGFGLPLRRLFAELDEM